MSRAVPPVADYGLIGDCHSAALVSRDGAIDWCCLPRFDSGSAFGRLLAPDAGTCVVAPAGERRRGTRRYVDGTMVLATSLCGPGGEATLYDCFVIEEGGGRGDERRRLVRVVEGVRGELRIRVEVRPRFDYGAIAPWVRTHEGGLHSAVGGDDGLLCWSDAGLAADDDHGLCGEAVVGAGDRVRVLIEFRRPEEIDDAAREPPAAAEVDDLLESTIARWRSWSGRAGDAGAARAGAHRSALVLKALTYAPTGAMIAAATASIPESAEGTRRWDYRYSWIRDAAMASRALADLGYEDEAGAFRRFAERTAAGSAADLRVFYGVGGERRVPEWEAGHLHTPGASAPVLIGNDAGDQFQLDAYGHLVEQSWRWHRRGHPPDDEYWDFLVDLVDTIAERWTEPDCGIWEWRGEPRHFVHSKGLCWAALAHGLELADETGRRAPVERWRAARDEVRAAVERDGFDAARGTFVQAFGHADLDAAVLRLPAADFLAFDDPRMASTVDALRAELEEDGLLRRYSTDDGLPGREGAFLACTFWLVECLARQGRDADARSAFERATATANDLGLFAEEHDPHAGLMLGNFPQALTHLSHIEAALALDARRRSAEEET